MDDQPRLFEGGPEIGEGDNSPVEHSHLPTGMVRERKPTLILSCTSAEERERVIELLGLRVNRNGTVWKAEWPVEDGELRLDV